MTDIKKTAWPAVIAVVVMLFVAGLAVAAFIRNSGKEDGGQQQEQAKGEQQADKDGGQQKNNDQQKSKEQQGAIRLDVQQLSEATYPEIAADMLQRIIKGEDISRHREILKNCSPEDLKRQLTSDELVLCFWLNLYNGYTQYLLKKDPTLYKNDRNEFFKKDQIDIAGYTVSMNDIEHGVLRRGATIWTKGHVRIPFKNDFVRHFKISGVDYRIHFALNCGAKSCPPVCVYLPDKTNSQLDKATQYYLQKECEYEKDKSVIKVPALMTWFAADFGTKDDKRDILKQYGVIPKDAQPDIDYKDYDWTMKIENYKQF